VKQIVWLGDSKAVVKSFPGAARQRAGAELWEVQNGFDPTDWKPMPSVGRGVREVRIKIEGQYRIIYLTSRPEGIYVLHAFRKKTRTTPKKDIDLAKERLKTID